jgi:hypothetical protein
MPDVRSPVIDRHILAIGKRTLQRDLLHCEPVRLCACVKVCSIGRKDILHVIIRNQIAACRVGFIGKGEAAVTPAGVASADGVVQSLCGAGVQDDWVSSDPSSNRIGVRQVQPSVAIGVGEDWGEVRGAAKTGVASGRKLPLDETRICGTFSTDGSFFNCWCIEIGAPVVCGIPSPLCSCCAICCWCCCVTVA